MDSSEVTQTLAGPAQRAEDPEVLEVIERQRRVNDVAAGRGRAAPLTTDAPRRSRRTSQRAFTSSRRRGRGRHALGGAGRVLEGGLHALPAKADGTVSVDNFVHTLKQLAGHGGATSADGRPGATVIQDADRVSDRASRT